MTCVVLPAATASTATLASTSTEHKPARDWFWRGGATTTITSSCSRHQTTTQLENCQGCCRTGILLSCFHKVSISHWIILLSVLSNRCVLNCLCHTYDAPPLSFCFTAWHCRLLDYGCWRPQDCHHCVRPPILGVSPHSWLRPSGLQPLKPMS